jgi:hypothetical protein
MGSDFTKPVEIIPHRPISLGRSEGQHAGPSQFLQIVPGGVASDGAVEAPVRIPEDGLNLIADPLDLFPGES